VTVQEGDNNLITRIRRSGGKNLEIRQEFSKEGLIYVSWHLKLKLLSIFPRRGPCIKLHCGKKEILPKRLKVSKKLVFRNG
jgi:hypothetical protein